MNGVPIPGVSAGSNHVGAIEMCTAQVIWPSGAAADGAAPSPEIPRRGAAARTAPPVGPPLRPRLSAVGAGGRASGARLVDRVSDGNDRRRFQHLGAGADLSQLGIEMVAQPVAH